MNSLFTKSSLLVLESLSFTKTLYAFDFDGTLSKIVAKPGIATISKSTEILMTELCKIAPVAILSGRSIKDLKQRLNFRPQFLVGNHGLEGLSGDTKSLESAHKICQIWKNKLFQMTFGPGVEIEDKSYSLAIHYRRSRSKQKEKNNIWSAINRLEPTPKIISGKSVINCLPLGAPHKGLALLEIMEKVQAKHAFYIGDDDTDEDVFSLPTNHIFTVRVGQKRNSHAKYYVRQQTDINKLLRLLIQYHRPSNHEASP